jgi:hypothetical protein
MGRKAGRRKITRWRSVGRNLSDKSIDIEFGVESREWEFLS